MEIPKEERREEEKRREREKKKKRRRGEGGKKGKKECYNLLHTKRKEPSSTKRILPPKL